MSGTRALWTDGQAVTTPDLQRGADAAAAADDLTYEALLPITANVGTLRRVLPLVPDDESGTPQVLVAAATFGLVTVGPALYEAAAETPAGSDVMKVVLAGRLREAYTSTVPIAANASGGPRTDLLYAVLSRATGAAQSRRVKGVDGQVSSVAIAVESSAQVLFVLAEGTTSAPAAGAGAYHFPLARITVPDGYVEGTTLTPSQIVQAWERAWVPATTVRAITGSEFGDGVAGVIEPVTTPPGWSRFGAEMRFAVVFKHVGNGASAWTLSDRIGRLDWRNRLVRFSLVRAVAHGAEYPSAHSVTTPGASVSETSSWLFTGTATGTIWTSARGFVLALGITGGLLQLSKPAGAAADGASGDDWLLVIETMDRFV